MQQSPSSRALLFIIALLSVVIASLGLITATSDQLVSLSEHPDAIVLAINH